MTNPNPHAVKGHALKRDNWIVLSRGQRIRKFQGRCECGEKSNITDTAGVVEGWHASHLEEVRNARTT